MKLMQTIIIAGLSFFLSTGIGFAADLDDLDLTIRVVETDDVEEMHNELSLPDAASNTAREHAEDEEGRGLTRANEVREQEHEDDNEHGREDAAGNDEREEHENDAEDHDDASEEHDEAQAEERHRKGA